MRFPFCAAAAGLAIIASGCTSDDSGARRVQAAPTPSAAAGAGFASTADIRAALEAEGLPCAEPMTGTYDGVAEAQSCILNDAEDVVLLRFATPAEKEQYVATKDELASAVVGADWAVQTVLPETAEQVAAALGGELVLGQGEQQPAG